jgi:hypothetical protein
LQEAQIPNATDRDQERRQLEILARINKVPAISCGWSTQIDTGITKITQMDTSALASQ